MIITLTELPPPLSACFTNRHVKPKGKAKGFVARTQTARYKKWINDAHKQIIEQCSPIKKICEPVVVTYDLVKPSQHKQDVANREKGLSDILVSSGILEDDHLIHDLRIRWVESDDPVTITLEYMK